jgi:hypothetical protein
MGSEHNDWLKEEEKRREQKNKESEKEFLDKSISEESKEIYSRFLANLKNQRDSTHVFSFYRKRLEHDISQVVASKVLDVLCALYTHLDAESKEIHAPKRKLDEVKESGGRSGSDGGVSSDSNSKGDESVRKWRDILREFYSDGILVGPLGERPIHICALMAARFRGEIEKYGIQIADGIVGGMKKFLENGKWKNEVRSRYGKDYVAAVCCCFKKEPKGLASLGEKAQEIIPEYAPVDKSTDGLVHSQNVIYKKNQKFLNSQGCHGFEGSLRGGDHPLSVYCERRRKCSQMAIKRRKQTERRRCLEVIPFFTELSCSFSLVDTVLFLAAG